MKDGGQIRGTTSWPARSGDEPVPATYSYSEPSATAQEPHSPAFQYQRIALVDLLDRLLVGGVVISGEVRLAIADVDLVTVSLRALIASASSVRAHSPEKGSS